MANVNIRVDDAIKRQAETIFSELGMSMSTATNIFYRQVARTGGIPFPLKLESYKPMRLDLSNMTHAEIDDEIQKGLDDFDAGRVYSSREIRAKMKEHLE